MIGALTNWPSKVVNKTTTAHILKNSSNSWPPNTDQRTQLQFYMTSLDQSAILRRCYATTSALLPPPHPTLPAKFSFRPRCSAFRPLSIMSSQTPAPSVSTVTISYDQLKVGVLVSFILYPIIDQLSCVGSYGEYICSDASFLSIGSKC